jgi:protein-L-isoaspartate(D-aspartate) O-methyltransferase
MTLPLILRRRLLAAGLAAPLGAAGAAGQDDYAAARRRMLAEIELDMRDTARSTGRERLDPRVAAAIGKVPRHRFVPAHLAERAYENRPLPIGHEQTISQPFIVALMTELVEPKPTDRVLEIGTGSGYQAAVLAELVARVYTIEIVRPLGERAAEVLRSLGYANVETRIGDGYLGWPEAAPFDAIVVTAAAAGRAAGAQRAADRAGGQPLRHPDASVAAQGRAGPRRHAQRAGSALRAADPRPLNGKGPTAPASPSARRRASLPFRRGQRRPAPRPVGRRPPATSAPPGPSLPLARRWPARLPAAGGCSALRPAARR